MRRFGVGLALLLAAVLPSCQRDASSGEQASPPSPKASLPPPPPGQPLVTQITMASASVGWVATDRGILRTEDAGAMWDPVSPPGIRVGTEQDGYGGVFFLGSQDAWVATASLGQPRLKIARTVDGGSTWADSALPMRFPDGYIVGGISFITPRQGWIEVSGPHLIPSASSFLFTTRDGGASWQSLLSPGFDAGPVFTGRRTGWGTWAQDPEVLFRSLDAGRTWHRARLMIPARYRNQHHPAFGLPTFFNASDGIEEAAFPGPSRTLGFYTTTDAGATWFLARTVQGLFNGGDFVPAASFLDRNHWTVFSSTAMYRTSDAGGSWTKATLIPAMRGVLQTDFPTTNEGWALDRGGTCLQFKSNCDHWSRLFRTQDGGATWSLMPIPRVR